MDAASLGEWLTSFPPGERDRALERRWGIDASDVASAMPGESLIGYHASGVAAVVRALLGAELGPNDVFVDLGAGLGKVTCLARLLTGCDARGIELQGSLVDRARALAAEQGIEATFVHGDVRECDLSAGTVFYLYAPFAKAVTAHVLEKLETVAAHRGIVVCALGMDLRAPWLVPRRLDDFWLEVYESRIEGAAPRCAEMPTIDTVWRRVARECQAATATLGPSPRLFATRDNDDRA